jgi:hypothetical protein
MSAIVLIAGTATHSIETVERVNDLKAGNREPTVFLDWDELVEGSHDFIVNIWKPDAEVACDWLESLQYEGRNGSHRGGLTLRSDHMNII